MKLARAIFAVLLAAAFASTLTSSASAADQDCKDFASQADAQAYFVNGGGSVDYNYNNLDHNRNGVACEDYGYSSGGSGTGDTSGSSGDVPANNGDTSGTGSGDTGSTDTSGDTTSLPNTGAGLIQGNSGNAALLIALSLLTLVVGSQLQHRRQS